MKRIAIASISILLVCACTRTDREQSISTDTLTVKSVCIVFYSPSSIGYTAMTGTSKGKKEIDEYLSDFSHYSSIVSDSFNKRHIPVLETTIDVIKIINHVGKVTVINTKEHKHPAGMIVSNGKNAPLVVPGIHTSEEYFTVIHSYLKQ